MGITNLDSLTLDDALTVAGAATITGALSADGGVSGNVTYTTAARTATTDGTGTGTIADAGLIQFVAVTSTDATHIVVLPTPTPGTIVILYVGANGFELRSSDPANVAIGGGTGAAAESAIAANQMAVLVCTSALTWHGWEVTAATLTAVEAAS